MTDQSPRIAPKTSKPLSDSTADLERALAATDHRLLVAMERCASVVGPDFFEAAAQLLSVLLGVEHVFIAECTNPDTQMARTLAFWSQGSLAEGFSFCATGGPCEQVLSQGRVLHVRENVCARFPDNEALQTLGPESYFGCPLVSSSGTVIGHIAAMDGLRMQPSPEDRAILRILASRAAAELERRQIEEERTHDRIRISEERLRLAQEAAEIGTWDMDVATGQGTWSDNYWELYGISPHSCSPGYDAWIALIHPDDRSRVATELKAALEGSAPYKTEFRVPLPDGSLRWLVGKGNVLRDPGGSPVRMIGVDYDVTDLKEAEESLRRMQTELEHRVEDRTRELREANDQLEREMRERERMDAERQRLERRMAQAEKLETLGVLTGGVAHDFNNLLVAIMGNSELALTCLDEHAEARAYVHRSVEAAERASELTQQLLSYSGKTQITPEPLDLSMLVADMVDLLDVTTGPKVSLRLDTAPRPVTVVADPTQVRQIVMNLLTNAVEAMPDGGEVLLGTSLLDEPPADLGRLYCSSEIAPRAYACLTIADAGKGLDEETCRQIFDPFFTTKFLGRGLGLAAVLGIVRSHDGVIAVDHADAGGTCFAVLLPASAELPATAAAAAPEAWRGSGTVLVVDDEHQVLETAAAMLGALGFQTVSARSGPEAIEHYEELHDELRLVLLDHAMPEMNGTEVLARLRTIDPHVPVVITSGYSEPEVQLGGGTSPAAGFLEKPYRLAELSARLRNVLAD